MISVSTAIELIREHAPERVTVNAPISEAAGRTLSQDIFANLSKPPAPVSAMDGYAVKLEDVRNERAELSVIGEAPAGAPFAGTVSSGEAVRIFTGATIPSGADHVVIQENTERHGDKIICLQSYAEQQHIREAGLDFKNGSLILEAGNRLSAHDASLAAAANYDTLPVFHPLKAAMISNGDELKPPGSMLGPGEIISANPVGIGALLRDWGADALDLGIAADSVEAITKKISDAPEDCNIFVAIGGASVGDHDHMRRAFDSAGFQLMFEKVAVRPGKPTWFAKRGNQLVLGLPGNPASALVCAHLFLRRLVEPLVATETFKAKASSQITKNGPRETYMRGVASVGTDAVLSVYPLPNQDSSLLSPLSKANCFIKRPPNQSEIARDQMVEIILFQPIHS